MTESTSECDHPSSALTPCSEEGIDDGELDCLGDEEPRDSDLQAAVQKDHHSALCERLGDDQITW